MPNNCCTQPASLPPEGPAGGDLTGSYPNPLVDPLKVVAQIASSASAQAALAQALCTALASCFPSSLPPSGVAGGDLTGSYPAPQVNAVQVAARLAGSAASLAVLAQALAPAIPVSGVAGGDLTGSYPAPQIDPLAVAARIAANSAALNALVCALCPPIQQCLDCASMDPQQVAAVFARCDGSPQIAGNALPTCDEVTAQITQAIGSIPTDSFLNLVGYDKDTHTLTFSTDEGEAFAVTLSDLLPIVTGPGLTGDGTVGAPAALLLKNSGGLSVDVNGLFVSFSQIAAPATTTGTSLPTTLYGGSTALLGAPNGWLNIGGSRVPYFT